MGGWKSMSCKERFAKVVMVLTIALLIVVIIMNAVIIYFSVADTWFTPCDECKPGSAPGAPPAVTSTPPPGGNGDRNNTLDDAEGVDCTLCCTGCGLKDEIFFYIMRTYNILFVALGIVAEWRPERFVEYAKICNFYFPRGFLYIFIGLLTVTGSLADPQGDVYADVIGYVVVAFGVLHLCMGLCCMGDVDEAEGGGDGPDGGRKNSYEMRDGQGRNDANYGGSPPPGGANNGYEYKYNGQSYTYNAGPAAI